MNLLGEDYMTMSQSTVIPSENANALGEDPTATSEGICRHEDAYRHVFVAADFPGDGRFTLSHCANAQGSE